MTQKVLFTQVPNEEFICAFQTPVCEPVGDRISIRASLDSPQSREKFALAAEMIKATWPDKKLEAHISYLGYAQSDRRMPYVLGSFGLKAIAAMLNALPIDAFYVIDPHSDVTEALLRGCRPIRRSISQILALFAEAGLYFDCIISPDAGAYKKLMGLNDSELPVIPANKYRGLGGSLEVHIDNTAIAGQRALIIDDICLGGRTFLELGKAVKNDCASISLYTTHPILCGDNAALSEMFDAIGHGDTRSHADVSAFSNFFSFPFPITETFQI